MCIEKQGRREQIEDKFHREFKGKWRAYVADRRIRNSMKLTRANCSLPQSDNQKNKLTKFKDKDSNHRQKMADSLSFYTNRQEKST